MVERDATGDEGQWRAAMRALTRAIDSPYALHVAFWADIAYALIFNGRPLWT